MPNPCIGHQGLNPHENRANLDSLQIKSQSVRIVFWNVENLYDPYDDTTTLDDEFTSGGAKHWTWSKFTAKLNHIAKTILAIGEWNPPAIIGLCEVENRYVLNKLIYNTPLKPWRYKFVHYESPDRRGVDVAMLYRPAHFRIIATRNVSIRFPFDTLAETREILYVKGVLFSDDTLSVFINHWPSRRGGSFLHNPAGITWLPCYAQSSILFRRKIRLPTSSSWVISMMSLKMKVSGRCYWPVPNPNPVTIQLCITSWESATRPEKRAH